MNKARTPTKYLLVNKRSRDILDGYFHRVTMIDGGFAYQHYKVKNRIINKRDDGFNALVPVEYYTELSEQEIAAKVDSLNSRAAHIRRCNDEARLAEDARQWHGQEEGLIWEAYWEGRIEEHHSSAYWSGDPDWDDGS